MSLSLLISTMVIIWLSHIERKRMPSGEPPWVSEWVASLKGQWPSPGIRQGGLPWSGDHRREVLGFSIRLSNSESRLHHFPAVRSWANLHTTLSEIPHLYKRDNNGTHLILYLCKVSKVKRYLSHFLHAPSLPLSTMMPYTSMPTTMQEG